MLKRSVCLAVLTAVAIATAVLAIEKQAFQMRDDSGMELSPDCTLQYYYYIPCPTYSWFWAFWGWDEGDIVGAWFQIGDLPTGGSGPCDPTECHVVETLRVLEIGGYCCYPRYPDMCWVDIDVYCADEFGCPIGPPI